MEFEWDAVKEAANRRKHHVSFDEAASVFYDPFALGAPDVKHSDAEDRWKTIGLSARSRVLLVVTADMDDPIRIISARRANAQEVNDYEQEIRRRTQSGER